MCLISPWIFTHLGFPPPTKPCSVFFEILLHLRIIPQSHAFKISLGQSLREWIRRVGGHLGAAPSLSLSLLVSSRSVTTRLPTCQRKAAVVWVSERERERERKRACKKTCRNRESAREKAATRDEQHEWTQKWRIAGELCGARWCSGIGMMWCDIDDDKEYIWECVDDLHCTILFQESKVHSHVDISTYSHTNFCDVCMFVFHRIAVYI